MILTSGRLVEYEGGGDEVRSNPWLAELAAGHVRRNQSRDANNLGIGTATESGSKGLRAARSR